MYVLDGYVYGGAPAESLKVVNAKVVADLSMLVTFSTGETRLFDASELLQYGAFMPLAKRSVFEGFSIDHGVLTWSNGEIDIAPEGLYKRTYEYRPTLLAK